MSGTAQSEYERLRLSNIQRNEEYLQKLGFEKKQERVRSETKRKRLDGSKKELVEPTRRSTRVAILPPVSYREVSLPSLSSQRVHVGKSKMEVIGDMELIGGDLLVGAANGVKDIEFESDVPTSSSGTCSSKNADLTYFLGDLTTIDVGGFSIKMEGYSSNKKIKKEETALQDSTVNHRLCVPVEHYGKAAVMALSNFGNLPRFSKYCGTLEWQNCVYLWVNIGGTSGYSNAFSEGGRHMMWYGGSKMHKDSKIVKRLARANKLIEVDKTPLPLHSRRETVILFARLEGENYCCLGRLQWVAIDLLSSPIKVKWELVDLNTFAHMPHFKRVLEHGGLV